ncbi:Disease resistance protein rga2 [Thalictrum thalictroides]|uniref:Disease resistance protein rga2 n=1 Tax=Thalictrum thalictroides TaxID=46969 RepID=A0A7J6VSD2_THATH|nr:Disease resistance protein rga2 [Thalictrum thalictroides]
MNECCNVVADGEIINVPEGSRHLSMSFKTTPSSSIFQSIHQSKPNLRTLISLIDMPTVDSWQGRRLPTHLNFSAFKSLRAMSLEDIRVTTLPDSIGSLRHLRYLKLSCDELTSLPESICRLRTLQTLKLMNCSELQTLPREMSTMINLRHLDIKKCYRLREMPIRMGELTCLQTLSIFIVGPDSRRHIKELQGLDNLGGELTVKGLEHVTSSKDAKEAMLMGKKNLRTLSLDWSDSRMEEKNDKDEHQLLQFHSLKKLVIRRCPKLERLPLSASLKRLDVEYCNEMVLRSLKDLRVGRGVEIFNNLAVFTYFSMSKSQSVNRGVSAPHITSTPNN